MSKISKTAAASMKGSPAEIKKDPFDTNEKKIRELRNQRRDKLAVGRFDFIDALIEEFDKIQLLFAVMEPQIKILLKENEKLNGDLNIAILQRDAARSGNYTDGAIDAMTSEGGHEPA